MAKKKQTKWENALIDYARDYGWRVYHIESWKSDGKTIRRFAFVKTNHPTIKVAFADDNIIGATQWYYGRLVQHRGVVTVATMKKWMRADMTFDLRKRKVKR